MMRSIIVALLAVGVSSKSCDNGCSGHGTCGIKGVCQCYDGWGVGLSHDSGDCSDRICPYEIAWVDAPDVNGNHHNYAECAGAGICDRTTGECQCFPGFEGKGCRRTACPNSCSGHGTCKYIEELGFGTVPEEFQVSGSSMVQPADYSYNQNGLQTFDYYSWDKSKTTACVCDPGYGDYDCSKKVCPSATDVMAVRPDLSVAAKNQIQTVFFVNDLAKAPGDATMHGQTFALTFTSKLNETFTTAPLKIASDTVANFQDFVLNVQFEMLKLPTSVIDGVTVTGVLVDATAAGATPAPIPGASNLITGGTATAYYMNDGFTLMPASYFASVPVPTCAGAAVNTGCNTWPPAFAGAAPNNPGLVSQDASIQTTANIDTTASTCTNNAACTYGVAVSAIASSGFYLNFEFTGQNVQGPQNLLGVKAFACADGCNPLITGLSLRPQSQVVMESQQSDLNSYECGRRGKCDYTTGMCTCFSGYTGASCNIITALV